MVEYKMATEENIGELKNIYSTCFSVSADMTNFYFEKKADIKNCAICTIDRKVVAALHMFETYINKNSQKYPVYYLYAAATLPAFRGKGYMKNLVNYANQVAARKGLFYSVLSPASEPLYKFYEKLGYKTFFKIRSVELTREALQSLIIPCFATNSPKNLELVRDKFFSGDGDIFWDSKHINYAISENKKCGGTTAYTENSYAICRAGAESVNIIEFVATEYEAPKLLYKIFNTFNCKKYAFWLKSDSGIFPNLGEMKNFGMIKSLTGQDELEILELKNSPYLGLALD